MQTHLCQWLCVREHGPASITGRTQTLVLSWNPWGLVNRAEGEHRSAAVTALFYQSFTEKWLGFWFNQLLSDDVNKTLKTDTIWSPLWMSVLQTVKLCSYCTLGNQWVVILQICLSNSHTHRTHTVNREGALAHCSVQSCVSAPWWLEMIGSQTTHTAETPRYMVTSRPPGIKGTERRVFPPGGEDQQFFTLHRVLQTTCEWPGFTVLEVSS